MNADYVARALCFHGPPMQKIWLDERGDSDFQKLGLLQPNFTIYFERQRFFTFQDRAKRLKLHQFITRKASELYPSDLRPRGTSIKDEHIENAKKNVAMLPPYEIFLKKQDKTKRRQIALSELKEGDIIYGDIKEKSLRMLTIRPLCTAEPLIRFMADLNIKAMVLCTNFGAVSSAGSGKAPIYNNNDYVCCEVQSVSLDSGRINLTMMAGPNSNPNVQLGVIQYDDLPAYYRQVKDGTGRYMDCLLGAQGFENPNYDDLYVINGLNVNDVYSLIGTLNFEIPREEYAKELRQIQAGKWAIRSVAEGIERFKQGQHLEAFQYLNKALTIDPHNVEGLVARGALYANKGSFLKAVADFEKALKLNVFHGNARKYLGETLVALGRSYEEENLLEDAAKAYQDCLNIIPKHEQAHYCLNAVNMRLCNNGLQPYQNLHQLRQETPGTAPHMEHPESIQSTQMHEQQSVISVTSSDDEGSSSDGSSDTSEGKTKSQISPLSQCLLLEGGVESPPPEYNRPFFATDNSMSVNKLPNDFQLDDDDTYSRVRRLLQAASKHKEAKNKSNKKKSKKSKKSTKDTVIATEQLLKNINFEAAFKAIGGMQFETKLTENLQMYEQTIAEIKKRHEEKLEHEGSETPPPPPSMKLPDEQPSTSKMASYAPSTSFPSSKPSTHLYSSSAKSKNSSQSANATVPKLSFQIKRPVKMDKFGLIRIATPLNSRSPTHSHSNSPTFAGVVAKRNSSKSRTRSRSYDRGKRQQRSTRREISRVSSRHHSRTRSPSRSSLRHVRSQRRSRSKRRESRPRHKRSRSRSRRKRSRSRSRRKRSASRCGRSRSRRRNLRSRSKRRKSRSLSNASSVRACRDSPKPQRRRSRSTESGDRRYGESATRGRVGRASRPPYKRTQWCPPSFRTHSINDSLPRDKFSVNNNVDDDSETDAATKKIDDGPSIEEIDEIIKEAQKERKQAIINNNKDILKKPFK